MSLIDVIDSPADLRNMPLNQLPLVCRDLRDYLIDTISTHGGHFGANLGVVELTVALHYVYNTPYDLLVWDVGHQAYGHKILTGRRDRFHTNRKYKGLSGFPTRSESPYDTFGVGHSSTSISAALGMAHASQILGTADKSVVSIIGDGAMTAGLAFEALNHIGVSNTTDILIILNDNNMSIDPNVGGLRNYLTSISISPTYNKLRDEIWALIGKLPNANRKAQRVASSVEAGLKGIVSSKSNLFEAFGLRYFGPTNGHDIKRLVHLLQDIKRIKGPKLLHLLTVKGKGYDAAERDQITWHAPGTFDKTTANRKGRTSKQKQPPKYQDVFGKTIIELALKNKKIVGITPAMPTGSSMKWMIEQMPDRAIDVGICEQHSVTLSAGMATQGMRVFCNIYSSFMQRAYDQLIHDVAIQNLPVVFCLDRAGLVGEDGATHHGAYDIVYMRAIPNMVVSAPMDEVELRNLMYTAQLESTKNPFSIRYPRGAGVTVDWQKPFKKIPVGKGRVISKGSRVAVLSIGHVGNITRDVMQTLSKKAVLPSHYDMRFAKPIDKSLLRHVFSTYDAIITVEDGCLNGGFGSAVLEYMHDTLTYLLPVYRMGIPDKIIEQGTPFELQKECGFDSEAIQKMIQKVWKSVS